MDDSILKREIRENRILIKKNCKMKKNYELSGMSCGGCVNNIKHLLL